MLSESDMKILEHYWPGRDLHLQS